MATTTLYPSNETFRQIVSAVQAGNINILWIITNQIALRYDTTVTVGPKVSIQNPNQASGFNG